MCYMYIYIYIFTCITRSRCMHSKVSLDAFLGRRSVLVIVACGRLCGNPQLRLVM